MNRNLNINDLQNKCNSIIAKAKETAIEGIMKAKGVSKEEATQEYDNLVSEQEAKITQMYGSVESIVNKFRNGAY